MFNLIMLVFIVAGSISSFQMAKFIDKKNWPKVFYLAASVMIVDSLVAVLISLFNPAFCLLYLILAAVAGRLMFRAKNEARRSHGW